MDLLSCPPLIAVDLGIIVLLAARPDSLPVAERSVRPQAANRDGRLAVVPAADALRQTGDR